jgi:hypothetical protein
LSRKRKGRVSASATRIKPSSRNRGSAIEHDPVRVCDSARLDHDLVRRRLAAKQFQQCNREVVHPTAAVTNSSIPLTFTLGLSSGRNSDSRPICSATAMPASHKHDLAISRHQPIRCLASLRHVLDEK